MKKLPAVPLGDDEDMQIGDWVLAFGSPFGLDHTVTQGIISAKARAVSGSGMAQEVIQTDAAINPGNSGGPLVNLKGEVIGINTAIKTRSGGYDGIGFAIPSSLAKWVADQLLDGGTVQRAYLGIEMQEINADLASSFNIRIPSGVAVTNVVRDSPADKAGFSVGDVILEVNGRKITGQSNLLGTVERLNIGKRYDVKVLRNGVEKTLRITPAERPNEIAKNDNNDPTTDDEDDNDEAGSVKIPGTGITVQDLTSELAEQLNLPDSTGVIINSVARGSTASEEGLSSGMVILRMGNREIRNARDLNRAIQQMKDKDRILLLVRIPNNGSSVSKFVTLEVAND